MKKYFDVEIGIIWMEEEVVRTSITSGNDAETPDLDENEMPFLPFG